MHMYASSIFFHIVPTLGQTIKTIRSRLRQTMAEFAETLGTQQSTISRYEAGQLLPNKSVLILLYLLAEDDERSTISEALGINDPKILEEKFSNAKAQLEVLKHTQQTTAQRSGSTDEVGANFANEAAAIISAGAIDPVLVELLILLRAHSASKPLRQALSSMLPYFRYCARSD
jgi:transcriptional regulator with XRE-family HTH domain